MDPVKALGRAGVFGNLLNQFDGGVEILDDLDDHWTAKNHKEERRFLIEDLQDLAAEKSVRITILGGDVHLAAIGQFYSNPKLGIPKDKDHRYMPNVISSAIVNTPPPDMMADILNKRNKIHHLDAETDEDMIPLFTQDVDGKKRNNKCLLPRRNWCSIREYNPDLSPPPTPIDDRSPSPPRPGLFRRLSLNRADSHREKASARTADSRPPISGNAGGLLRRLSTSRGRPSMDERPAPPRRSLSLARDFTPGSLLRRLSSRGRRRPKKPDSGGINGYGADSDSEDPAYSDEALPRHPAPRMRGGSGGEGYFDRRAKGKYAERDEDAYSFDESPPPSAAAERGGGRHGGDGRFAAVEAVPRPRNFQRTPTGLNEMAARGGRAVREEDAVNLEGGLEVTLNVEVSAKDPAGITTPYRLLVPRLWVEDGVRLGDGAGVVRKGSVVKRLLSFKGRGGGEMERR